MLTHVKDEAITHDMLDFISLWGLPLVTEHQRACGMLRNETAKHGMLHNTLKVLFSFHDAFLHDFFTFYVIRNV